MTETAKIAANNAYQRQVAQADADYAADMTELNNYVRTEQERLDDKAYERQQAEAAQEKADKEAMFNEAKQIITSGQWNTTAELENYVSGVQGKVSEDQYNILMQYANTYKNDPEQQLADANVRAKELGIKIGSSTEGALRTESWDKGVNDDRLVITLGGERRRVRVDTEAGADVKAVLDTVQIPEGRVFLHGEKMYIKKDGKYYNIKPLGTGNRARTRGYDDLYRYLAGQTAGLGTSEG